MTPSQMHIARGLLAWSRDCLATAAGVSVSTVYGYETWGRIDPKHAAAIRDVMEKAGIEFTDENTGVKLRVADQ